MKIFTATFQFTLAAMLIGGSPIGHAQSLSDPGFESGGLGAWSANQHPEEAVVIDRASAKSGAYGAKISSKRHRIIDFSQTIQSLTDGQYILSASFRNGGGQAEAFLYAKSCGEDVRQTSVPVSSGWTKVIVRGVQVRGGSCTIGLHVATEANKWLVMDDIEFTPDYSPEYRFLQGGDVSRLSYIESLGAKFYADGKPQDAMKILGENGFNYVRLRAYNDPGNPKFNPSSKLAPGFQGTDDILGLARRAHANGMETQLSLNYSDWWADSCVQDVPHEWVGKSYDDMKKAVYDYTFDIVAKMKAQGTVPSIVSLGNQMQCGILLQPGKYGPVEDWSRLAPLLNAGAEAVKAASPTSKVMLHLDSPGNAQWFFDGAKANNVKFDVIGLSWYPYWESQFKHRRTETLAELLIILNEIAARFQKDILIMETGTNWSRKMSTGWPGQLKDGGKVGYPETKEGQRDFAYDLMNTCKSVDGGRCIGIQWWDPVAVNQPGFGWIVGEGNSNDNSTLFDWKHAPLPVLKQAFKINR